MAVATALVYLVAAVLFILGLRFLSSPRSARRGNQVAAAGMVLAVGWTGIDRRESFSTAGIVICVAGVLIGSVAGGGGARPGPLTPVPPVGAPVHGRGRRAAGPGSR